MISGSTGWERRAREAEARLVKADFDLQVAHGSFESALARCSDLREEIRALQVRLDNQMIQNGDRRKLAIEELKQQVRALQSYRPTQGDLDTMRARLYWVADQCGAGKLVSLHRSGIVAWKPNATHGESRVTAATLEDAIDMAIFLDK